MILNGLYNFSQRMVQFHFLYDGYAFVTDAVFVEKKLIPTIRAKITGKVCAMAIMHEDKSGNEMYL